jgi:hypothetical protein
MNKTLITIKIKIFLINKISNQINHFLQEFVDKIHKTKII